MDGAMILIRWRWWEIISRWVRIRASCGVRIRGSERGGLAARVARAWSFVNGVAEKTESQDKSGDEEECD